MSSTCLKIVWLQGLLRELCFPHITPTPLHANNTGVIQSANNLVFHERTKHIEVDCHYIPFVSVLFSYTQTITPEIL